MDSNPPMRPSLPAVDLNELTQVPSDASAAGLMPVAGFGLAAPLPRISAVAATIPDHLRATPSPRPGWYPRWGKRPFDLAIGISLLVLALPLLAVVALVLAMAQRGNPLYTSRRAGKGGRAFSMLKFRTMVPDADRVLAGWRESAPELVREYESNFKLRHDPRVTRTGGFLRRTSLDELPQLWNVVRGEMSLVGPRPYLPGELEKFPGAADLILRVRPGLTGPWQIRGRHRLTPHERVQIEAGYDRDLALRRDAGYFLTTLLVLVRCDGA